MSAEFKEDGFGVNALWSFFKKIIIINKKKINL